MTLPVFMRHANDENLVTAALLAVLERLGPKGILSFVTWAGIELPKSIREESIEVEFQHYTQAGSRIPDGRIYSHGEFEVLLESKLNDRAWSDGQLRGEFALLADRPHLAGLLLITDGPPPDEFRELQRATTALSHRSVSHRTWYQVYDWMESRLEDYLPATNCHGLIQDFKDLLSRLNLTMFRGFDVGKLLSAAKASDTLRTVVSQYLNFNTLLNNELRSQGLRLELDTSQTRTHMLEAFVEHAYVATEITYVDWGGNAFFEIDFDFPNNELMIGLWVNPAAEPRFYELDRPSVGDYEFLAYDYATDEMTSLFGKPAKNPDLLIGVAIRSSLEDLTTELSSLECVSWCIENLTQLFERFGSFVDGIPPLPSKATKNLHQKVANNLYDFHAIAAMFLAVEEREHQYSYMANGTECIVLAWGGTRNKTRRGVTLWISDPSPLSPSIKDQLRNPGYLRITDGDSMNTAHKILELVLDDLGESGQLDLELG